MAENFYTILTTIGKAKLANAYAFGTKVNMINFAVGDGQGAYYNPTEDQTALKHEVWRGNTNSVTIDEQNPNWIVIETVIPSNIGGFTVREAGVFDDTGTMIAIGKFPETYKPVMDDGSAKDLYIKMILQVTNASTVTLKVDPSIVLATKKDIQNIVFPVTKVNGKTGDLTLKASDIKADDGTTLEAVKESFDTHKADNAYADDTGVSNAYVINPNPAPTAYKKGQTYTFLAKQNNSGASTLKVANLGAIPIRKNVVEGSYVADFAGKVAESTTENPNIFKRGYNSALLPPSSFTTEHTTSDYNKITNLDSICKEATANAADRTIPQQLFQFDIVKEFEKRFGPIPTPLNKGDYVKKRISRIQCDAYIYGSGPNGNKVYIARYIASSNQWSPYDTAVVANTSSSPSLVTKQWGGADGNISDAIDSNGMVSYLVYTDASDGITASTIYTDYVKLTVTFKHGDDLVAGDISAGRMVTVKHDGIAFQLMQNESIDTAKFKKSNLTYTTRGTTQTFTDAFCTADSLVTVSITSSTIPQGVWKVDSANGSFTITSTVAETADITFDYYIQKAVI